MFQLLLAAKDPLGDLELHGGGRRAAARHRRDLRAPRLAGQRRRPRGTGE